MEKELEELIQKRRNLIQAHEDNDFIEGIHNLLTELYPDTAHFIYELLQNAEDMNATNVRFVLSETEIKFEHNGSKRSFNIADITAITSIGANKQKKQDHTSIGKFGVGFKAVFAYTSTPIIHSGKYHFKIVNDFVPEFEGVEHIPTCDSEGVEWTKFEFPFNHPEKSASNAYNECLEGLKELDALSVLFLQNIKRIDYRLSSSSDVGYVERTGDGDEGAHIITIESCRISEQTPTTSRWLKFHRFVDIVDEQKNKKHLSIGVAFALEHNDSLNKDRIVPVKNGGSVFIYFPAEKEFSNLRFHINAPFASTVARDSIRDCEDNQKLIQAVARMICDGLGEIKKMGMMDHSFFETLPNYRDILPTFYQCVFEAIKDAFRDNDFLPIRGKSGYVSSTNALLGAPAISEVLTKEDIRDFFRINKIWIQNASQRNSNADHFLHSLNVETFDYDRFSKIFDGGFVREILSKKTVDWLKNFYFLCYETFERLTFSKQAFILQMKKTSVIRSSRGTFYRPADIYILDSKAKLLSSSTPIVDKTFITAAIENDRRSDKIRFFFQDVLGIQPYGIKVEIERLLKCYEDSVSVNDTYFNNILLFAEYGNEHNDVDFSASKIFISHSKNGREERAKASDIFLGSAYGNSVGEVLADFYGVCVLGGEYAKRYKDKDLETFLKFVKKLGIKQRLNICRQDAEEHPRFWEDLRSSGGKTKHRVSQDYSIPNLLKLLNKNSFEISKIIWTCLWEKGNELDSEKYTQACYSPNKTATPKSCDSTLIYLLKKHKWVPDKSKVLFKPEDIIGGNLHPAFRYNPDNPLLAALELGGVYSRDRQKRVQAEQCANEAGGHFVSDEDFELLQRLKEREAKRRAAQKNEDNSVDDLFNKQNKKARPNPEGDDDFSSDGTVYNVEKREVYVEKTFQNVQRMKPIERKLFGRIVESTAKEKSQLLNWYQGKCQMCDSVIRGYDGKPHFIAKNIINTSDLSDEVRKTVELAWNSLCLCPNCAKKYEVCSRDLNGLYTQIVETPVVEGSPAKISLEIMLDEKKQKIYFVPKHFFVMKKTILLIEEILQKKKN